MISIIVPVYKTEKYLRKCVESIKNQTYKNIEIILVDDGSPDKCGQICDQLAENDSRIKVIHQENGGQASARNAGLNYALDGHLKQTEHFITFIDSDDSISSKMYETMMDGITSEIDLIICGSRIVKESVPAPEIHGGGDTRNRLSHYGRTLGRSIR